MLNQVLDTMPEAPFISEEELVRKEPEIIANPVLSNTKLVMSTPIRNEMQNGHVLRHLNAFLRQHLPDGVSAESNYIVNGGITEDNQITLNILRKVVKIQGLSRVGKNSKVQPSVEQQLSNMLESESDPIVQRILRSAVERCHDISISAINDMNDTRNNLNYRAGTMGNLRTLGMDYANKRVLDKDAVFHLYDVDTVPENNNYIKDLLAIYDTHPEINYVFANLTHLPAGQHKDLVAHSPMSTARAHYNWGAGSGSPQISFRLKSADKIKAVMPRYWHRDEDRDTSYRLIGMFGDDQKDVLKLHDVTAFPRSLASDRTGGTVDGAERLKWAQKGEPVGVLDNDKLPYALKARRDVLEKITQLPPDLSIKAQQELESLRKTYEGRQKALTRFNKSVVRTFLSALDEKIVTIDDGAVIVDEKALLQKRFGQSLLFYIRANKDLLLTLSQDDLELMKYYIDPSAEFPPNITQLNPFQIAIREYIGDYDPNVYTIHGDTTTDDRGDNVRDKRTVYEPFLTEMLAVSNIDSVYFRDEEFLERAKNEPTHYDWTAPEYISESYATRADWMDAQLSQVLPKDSTRHSILDTINTRFRRLGYQLGSILESKLNDANN